MEIAFDAKRIFHNGTGLGNYSRTLVHNLSRMYPEHNLHLCTPELSDNTYALPFCDAPFNHMIPQGNTPGSWWRTMGMAKDLSSAGIQLFHGLINELPSGLAAKKIASVVSIHDLLFLDFPGDYKWMDRQIYKHKFSKACERADKVIAISQATKDKIINYFHTPEEKVEVIYQAVNPFYAAESPEVLKTTVRSKWDLHYGFILFVSALSPRKKHTRCAQSPQHDEKTSHFGGSRSGQGQRSQRICRQT
jgi:glycosyltransferase involved in cell wall biosynthesis